MMSRRTILLILASALSLVAVVTSKHMKKHHYADHPAVELFREYLRIDTSHDENLERAVEFWRRQAADVGLQFRVYKPAGKPICVLTWEGADPAQPSVMLNSHMDVVSVEEKEWSHPPFEAHMDDNGDIFARGAQDTKDIAIQYLEAIRRLKQHNVVLDRTMHITLMPDEETGGFLGIQPFLKTPEFRALNIGFALDEGLASKNNVLFATYHDRRPWQMNFTVVGEGGHGFQMYESAMEKTERLLHAVMKFRNEQKSIMKWKGASEFGAYTSINVNVVNGGVAPNIIPASVNVVVDMRLATHVTAEEADALIKTWMSAAGNGTRVKFIRRVDRSEPTRTDDENHLWYSVRRAVEKMGYTIKPIVCPATSDMVYVRNLGIPALGFTYKPTTVARLHGSNEYLNAAVFLKGINIYAEVLKNIGSL